MELITLVLTFEEAERVLILSAGNKQVLEQRENQIKSYSDYPCNVARREQAYRFRKSIAVAESIYKKTKQALYK